MEKFFEKLTDALIGQSPMVAALLLFGVYAVRYLGSVVGVLATEIRILHRKLSVVFALKDRAEDLEEHP